MGRRRRARVRAAPAPIAGDGDGRLIGFELEARLFGRIRLLTAEATVAVGDSHPLVVDLAPPSGDPGRPVGTGGAAALPPGAPGRLARRAGLEEAASLVREARDLLAGGPG